MLGPQHGGRHGEPARRRRALRERARQRPGAGPVPGDARDERARPRVERRQRGRGASPGGVQPGALQWSQKCSRYARTASGRRRSGRSASVEPVERLIPELAPGRPGSRTRSPTPGSGGDEYEGADRVGPRRAPAPGRSGCRCRSRRSPAARGRARRSGRGRCAACAVGRSRPRPAGARGGRTRRSRAGRGRRRRPRAPAAPRPRGSPARAPGQPCSSTTGGPLPGALVGEPEAVDRRGQRRHASLTRSRRSSRSATIRAVAPQIRWLADLVGVGAERHPAADQPPARVAAAHVASSGSSSTSATSASADDPLEAGLDQPDERIDRVVGDERRRRLQRADAARPPSGGSPISSCASRSAVAPRSASPGSRRPPGNEISPAWRRRSSRRWVKTACSAPSASM